MTAQRAGGKAATSGAVPLSGKIALEEHYVIPETLEASFASRGPAEFQHRIEEIGEAAEWFDHAAISEADRMKIASANTRLLFRL
jgi:hypothetical protein